MSAKPKHKSNRKPAAKPRAQAAAAVSPAVARELAELRARITATARKRAMYRLDLDGVLLYANDNFLRPLGYAEDEIVGTPLERLLPETFRASARYRKIWEALRAGGSEQVDLQVRAKDGREVAFQTNFNAVVGADGRAFEILSYATDVTDQRMRSADCEGQIAAISRVQAVIEFSLDGRILRANENFLRTVGYTLEEIQGQHHRMFVDPVQRETVEYQRFWERLGRGEYDAGQYQRLAKGGRKIWLQANYSPILDVSGHAYKVVKYATDITAAKEAELAVAERERRQAAEIARVKRGLDVVATNVMVADGDYNIVYLNDSIRQMLAEAEADIRKELPAFSAAKVLGANIDVFHKNPSYQRGMLDRLDRAHKATLKIGGRTFNLILNPIVSGGERLGIVVEWKDMTAELAAAEREKRIADENVRIRNALDNVNTNVMIANNDREIMYVNKSIMQMLGRAESDLRRDLPNFDLRRIMGGSIDQFHRNPEHQKRMLENLRDTHRAQVKIGGRTFALTLNPIVNEGGERLGTVVEWLDRTVEVAVEAEVGGIVQAAANGDFTRRIAVDGKEGFFRLLADNVNQLLDSSAVGLDAVAAVLAALAKGDLTRQMTGDFRGTFAKLKDDANSTIGQLTTIVSQIKHASDLINTAAGEIAAGNSDLSARTEQQAASLEETASSMEELTSTVKQNAENAKQANQLAIGAADVASRGGQVVAEVVTTMEQINGASKKIVDIISVIDGIAFQTNILALNAAVEAARAGEQGRGFAVVAAEVRSLAQRSAAAAKEIKGLIGDSVEKVGNGSRLVEQAGKTMEEIVVSVKRVTDIMSEISAASQEQSQGIEQVSQTVTQMDEVTQQNAALVEEAAASAQSLEEQAGSLAESVSRFTLQAGAAGAVAPPSSTPARAAEPRPQRPAPARRPAATAPVQRRAAAVVKPNGNGHSHAKAKGEDQQWSEF